MALRSAFTQLYPPKPTFTEQDTGPQSGRVFIVTGGNTGVGYELCKQLYGTGATIYMASRSKVSHYSQASQSHLGQGPLTLAEFGTYCFH